MEEKTTVENESLMEEDSIIYQRRTDESDTKKVWKDLTFRQKVQFFKDYYLIKTIVAIIVLCVAGNFLYTILKPKKDAVLYATVVFDALDETKVNAMHKELDKLFDVQKDQEVVIDTSFLETNETKVYGTSERLQAMLYAHQLDVIISDQKEYEHLGYYGNLTNLDIFLPDDVKELVKDDLIISPVGDDDDPNQVKAEFVMGIDLSNCKKYKDLGSVLEKPILSIPLGANNEENAVKFLRYLYE